MNENPTDDSALDELVAQYLQAIDDGRTIPVQTVAGIDSRIRERFIRFIELSGDLSTAAVTKAEAESKFELLHETFDRTGFDYGEFRVIRTLGVGGMGIVYVAKHRETEKLVAIKVLRQSIALHRSLDQRFQREVQAIASLSHANIVPLVDSGFSLEHAFLAMELIDGVTLTDVIAHAEDILANKRHNEKQDDDATNVGKNQVLKASESSFSRTPVTSVSAAECAASFLNQDNYFTGIALLAATIADALAVAHRAGIVHRDIKPSNILLDATGKAWLTDFGLASFADDQTALTMTGEIVGTPAYMSPEQTMGPNQQVDARSDVYSLGATLFELVTFQKPFEGNRHQILFRVMRGDVAAPRAIRPEVPADLEAIILKAMARSPNARYHTASDFAADLRRFATGKTVHAKRPGTTERAYHWIEKNPLVALTTLLGLIATIIGIFTVQTINSHSLQTLNRELATTNEELSNSNETLMNRERELRQQLYVSDVSAAFKAYEDGDFPQVRELLQQHRNNSGAPDLRGSPWYLLDSLSRAPDPIELTQHDGPATALSIFPGDHRAVSVGHDGDAHLFDLHANANAQSIAVGGPLDSIAVSPDGKSILTALNAATGLNSTRRYDVESRELIAKWRGHSNSVESAVVSPNGSLFATADRYNEIQIHDPSGKLVHRITTDSRNESLSFFNSNTSIAAIFRDTDGYDSLKIRNLADGQMSDLAFGFDPKTFACSLPNGTDSTFAVVAAGTDKIGVLQRPGDERILEDQQIVGRIRCVDISPDGKVIVAGCDEGSVFIWRLTELREKQPVQPPQVIYASEQRINSVKIVVDPTEPVSSVASKSVGILTASDDGHVRLWSMPQDNPRSLFATTNPLPESIVEFAWAESPDAESVYLRMGDGSIGVLDSSLEFHRISSPPTDKLEAVFATPSGNRIVVATPTQLVTIDPQTGLVDRQVDKVDTEQSCADMLVVAGELFALFNDHIMVIDCETLEQRRIHRLPDDNAEHLVRVPGTDKIRVVTRLNIHELDRRQLSTVLTSQSTAENFTDLTYSDSGDRMAICNANGSIRVESRDDSSKSVLLLGHRKRVLCCLFLDDGRTLATTANDRTLRLWNLETGRELGTLNLPNSAANGLHYFQKTGKLVTTHYDDPPQIWTLSPRD